MYQRAYYPRDIKSRSAFEALTFMDIFLEVGIPVLLVIVAVIAYLVFPRVKGLHYTSRLTCPKCGKQFDYEWVPGGSFSVVRLWNQRYMRCPKCHRWSTFEIWKTRINESKTGQTTGGKKAEPTMSN
jgi:DNA-directed RNA polymerase subunit RPC12/RpoP